MTIPEAAAALRCSKSTVRRCIKEGSLTRYEIRRRVFVARDQVEQLPKKVTCKDKAPAPATKKRASTLEHWTAKLGLGRKAEDSSK